MSESARPYAPTALPSVTARLLAFLAILVGGLCGGLIGWSVTDLQCGSEATVRVGRGSSPTTIVEAAEDPDEDCTAWNGAGGLLGAVVGAGGTGVVAVLVLRAMSEWRRDLDVDEAPDTLR